jgi:hypothetical protein
MGALAQQKALEGGGGTVRASHGLMMALGACALALTTQMGGCKAYEISNALYAGSLAF